MRQYSNIIHVDILHPSFLPSSSAHPPFFATTPTNSWRSRHSPILKVIRNLSGDSQENQLSGQEFFEAFLKERRYTSDFVSRASDILWKRELLVDDEELNVVKKRLAELQKIKEKDDSDGFLKLSGAKKWELGMDGAPTNMKLAQNGSTTFQDDWRRAGFLEYEALKRELLLLTTIVAACGTLYCGIFISFEGCLSYAIGALARIGIRSSDLQDAVEKTFFGSGFALTSPRLLIPVALYILWALVHRSNELDLEIAPLMFGFFAYKAALLIQAYRDNKELAMVFEKDEK